MSISKFELTYIYSEQIASTMYILIPLVPSPTSHWSPGIQLLRPANPYNGRHRDSDDAYEDDEEIRAAFAK